MRRALAALALTVAALAVHPAVARQAQPVEAPAAVDVTAIRADDRILGRAEAPVTVIEYASFTCSHCAEWWTGVFPAFKAQFVDTGRVRLILRDLPTSPAQASFPAAIVARCSDDDRFYDAADVLLSGRMALTSMADVPDWLARAGEAGGLTREEVGACLADEANGVALEARIEAARSAGVTGTPTFFVNGRRVAGHDLPTLEAAIVAAEAGAAPGAP